MSLLFEPDRALMRGIPTKVVEGNFASGTSGTASSHAFSIVKDSMTGGDTTFQAPAPGLAVTAFSGNIEQTLNQGVSWSKFQAFDLFANPTVTFTLLSGVVYRFNITTVTYTGGTSGLSVLACLG